MSNLVTELLNDAVHCENVLGETNTLERMESILAADDAIFDAIKERRKQRKRLVTPAAKVKRRRRRRSKANRPRGEGDNGAIYELTPRQSGWYYKYVLQPKPQESVFRRKFRRRFRLPFEEYVELLEEVKANQEIFGRWMSTNAAGKESSPIELLLLGALRYLGRGLAFDDLEDYTAIGEETHRLFFHRFIDWGSTILFSKHVVVPTSVEDASIHSLEFQQAGLPGAIGSMDATHVMCERISHRFRQNHMGAKMSFTARTYNLVCNHRRRILSTTRGHPARSYKTNRSTRLSRKG